MGDYRRLYIPGGTYFFTLVCYRRQAIFADEQHVILLRQTFREVKNKRPFELLAAVILPDHLHCVWTLPGGDADFSTRWQMVKTAFSRRVPAEVKPDGAKTLWQPRFVDKGFDRDDFLETRLDVSCYPISCRDLKRHLDKRYINCSNQLTSCSDYRTVIQNLPHSKGQELRNLIARYSFCQGSAGR